MSEVAKQLFDGLKAVVKDSVQAVAPGLKDLVPEAMAEVSRLGTQGSMEMASALLNGHAFVPYGPGQYTPEREEEQQHQQERGGIER